MENKIFLLAATEVQPLPNLIFFVVSANLTGFERVLIQQPPYALSPDTTDNLQIQKSPPTSNSPLSVFA